MTVHNQQYGFMFATVMIICYYGQMHKTGVKPEIKIIITSLHYRAILPLEELK